MRPVHIRSILRPVRVNVRIPIDILPDLFPFRGASNPFHYLLHMLADNGTKTLPAALSVTDEYIILTIEQPGIFQNAEPPGFCFRPFLLRYSFKTGNFLLNLRFRPQLPAPQIGKLPSAQSGSFAEFNQLVVVRSRKMPVSNCVAPAPFYIRPVPFGRLKIFFIVRPYPVQLAERLCFKLHRPSRQSLFRPYLQPLIHIFFCAFQRGTVRVVRLNIFDKIFCVFPVGLIGAARKNLFPIRFRVLCFPFAFAKGLHTSQAVIRLLVQGFGILLVPSSQENRLPHI